ncbi:hypothetical protein RCH06_002312 [Polaromonas sp. CG_9.5]|nr:hypothetical protein [Polaromonas sp. CG_9.5]
MKNCIGSWKVTISHRKESRKTSLPRVSFGHYTQSNIEAPHYHDLSVGAFIVRATFICLMNSSFFK